jgi:hypothetical protein
MKAHIFVLLIGITLGVLVAVPLTAVASSWSLPFMASVTGPAQEGQEGQGQEQEPSKTHQQMHEMMDAMHGEGPSRKMHEAMPSAEEMMEECARHVEEMKNGHMIGMMMEGSGMMNPSGINP